MPDEARLIVAFALALGAAFAATPVAISTAARVDFHDKPVGYKGHAAPTPYLGGAAVLGGFALGALTLGGEFARLSPIFVSAFALWALGTLDDRVGLSPWLRVGAEAALAAGLWNAGLGWNLFPGDAGDLALTIVWVVGLVNAFNLLDNMDGAAATIASVTGIAVGVLALIGGDVALAVLTFGLAGACLGFLPYNLAKPARIFLGDGGSLPIGFVLAASLMALPQGEGLGLERLLAAVLLAGIPVLDTTLVTVSRRRAGIPLLTGGRDHLTHRLQSRLGTARSVALTLGIVQACLGAVAIGVVQLGRGSVLVAWSIWFVLGTATIVLLETATWAPVRESANAGALPTSVKPHGGGPAPSLVEAALIAGVSISCALSPFRYGFYDVSVWGPITLGLLAGLLGLLIARPARPRRGALLAAGSLAAFWVWALLSSAWAESADQAITDADRWLLYATLFAIVVMLLRNDRLSTVLIGAGVAGIVALGGYLMIRMLAGSASSLFLSGRLNGPLGYINGEAAYLMLGVWPLIAVAERTRSAVAAGLAVCGAVALGALALLGQTRAVLPAVVIAAMVLLAVVPGRVRRGWLLIVVLGGIAGSLGSVLAVYDSAGAAHPPADDVLRHAAGAIVLSSVIAGLVWAVARSAAVNAARRSQRVRRWSWVPLVASAAVAGVFILAAVHDPVGRLKGQYVAFTQLQRDVGARSRFTTGAGNRYDYWRVAWHQFNSEPLRGVGAGNYDRTYFLERRITEDIKQPHSIELQTLGELGVVGGALLALFVAAVLAGFWRRCRAARGDARAAGLAVAAGGAFLAWLVQTSVDWLHLIPGLTGLALCSAAVLVGPWKRPRGAETTRVRLVVVVLAGIAVVVGAILVGRVSLAAHYRGQGEQALSKNPIYALQKARDSLALNDEAMPTYYLRSAAWARLGDYPQARQALSEATRREPHDFVPWALLGDLATRRGDLVAARADYRRSSRLNPRDPSVRALAANPPASPDAR